MANNSKSTFSTILIIIAFASPPLFAQEDSLNFMYSMDKNTRDSVCKKIDKMCIEDVLETDMSSGMNLFEHSILYHEYFMFSCILNKFKRCKKQMAKLLKTETPIKTSINSGNVIVLHELIPYYKERRYIKSGKILFDYAEFAINFHAASSLKDNDSEFLKKIGVTADIRMLDEMIKIGGIDFSKTDEKGQNILFKIYPIFPLLDKISDEKSIDINVKDITGKTVSDYLIAEILTPFRIYEQNILADVAMVKKLDNLGFKTSDGKKILLSLYLACIEADRLDIVKEIR
jgi:hypothetical protein